MDHPDDAAPSRGDDGPDVLPTVGDTPQPPPALMPQPPAEPLAPPLDIPMAIGSGPIVRPGPPPRVFDRPAPIEQAEATRVRRPAPAAVARPAAERRNAVVDGDVAGPPPILWRGLIVLPWILATSSVSIVVLGAAVFSLGMSLRQAVLATVIGMGLTLVPLAVSRFGGSHPIEASWSAERATFGLGARGVPLAIIHVARTLWAAIALWLVSEAVSRLAVVYGLTPPSAAGALAIAVLVFGLVAAVFIPLMRPALLVRARLATAGLAVTLAVIFVAVSAGAVDIRVALTFEDGPWTLVLGGSTLVASTFALLWVTLPPLGRSRRNVPALRRSDPVAALIASVIPTALIAYGALLGASNPATAGRLLTAPMDALAALVPAWFAFPLVIAVGLGLIAVVSTAAQTGGVAIRRLGFGFSDGASTLIAASIIGVLGVILAGLVDDMALVLRDLVTTLAVPVATWLGAMSVAVALHRSRRSGPAAEGDRPAHVTALVGVGVALVVGFGLSTASMSALRWEGYLFALVGLPRDGDVASSGVGILAAFALAGAAVAVAPLMGRQSAAGDSAR